MNLKAAAECSVGIGAAQGGRSRNEDNYLLAMDGQVWWREGEQTLCQPWIGAGLIAVVADGMGGHADGHIASLRAVQSIAGWPAYGSIIDPEDALRRLVQESHNEIRATMARPIQMGTTLCCIWVLRDKLHWCNVGDSRLYILRRGVLHLLTRDHTREEFARRDGRPHPSHPHLLAQNFIYGSRGLGDDHGLRIDRGVDTGSIPLEAGDRLLLCSDGIYAWLEEAEIGTILRDGTDPRLAAQHLVRQAMIARSDDNLTALVLFADRQILDPGATIIPR